MALAGGDGADDQPYDERKRSIRFSPAASQANAMVWSGIGWLVACGCQRRRPAAAE